MPKRYKRTKYYVDPAMQSSFIIKFSLIVIISSFLIGLLVYFFTKESTTVTIENTKVLIKPTSEYILPILFIIVSVVATFTAIFAATLSMLITHRIIGPIARLRREIDCLAAGNLTRDFYVRDKDHLEALAKSLNNMSHTFRAKHHELKDKWRALSKYLELHNYEITKDQKKQISIMKEELNAVMNYFKV